MDENAVPQEADGRKHSRQSEAKHLTGSQSATVRGSEERTISVQRWRTLRQSCASKEGQARVDSQVSAEGHAECSGSASGLPNPQDRARRRVPV